MGNILHSKENSIGCGKCFERKRCHNDTNFNIILEKMEKSSDWALKSYKAMVNDTIANALNTIQCKTIPYNSDWNT